VDTKVAFAKGSKYRIRNRVYKGVGIGVSIRSAI
jgi:hypothetical protein